MSGDASAGPTPWLIDTSVSLKCYLPEVGAAEARAYLAEGLDRHAPDHFAVEGNHVALKRSRRNPADPGYLPSVIAEALAVALRDPPIQLHPSAALLEDAYGLAATVGCSVYDALFLALAFRLDGELVTADRPLHDKVRSGPHAGRIRWYADAP